MLRPTRSILGVPLAAALALAGFLAASHDASAYTVITRDGFRIEVKKEPEVKGLQAYMRTEPEGRLVVIQEEKIDWDRTRAVNGAKPAPKPLAVRSDEILVDGKGRATTGEDRPREIRIIGGKRQRPDAASDDSVEEPSQAAPSETYANEAIINLQKEYAKLAAMRDQAVERKKALQAELDGLREKMTSYAGQEDPLARKARELQEQVDIETRRIGKLETRLGDIRAQAVQLGGTID